MTLANERLFKSLDVLEHQNFKLCSLIFDSDSKTYFCPTFFDNFVHFFRSVVDIYKNGEHNTHPFFVFCDSYRFCFGNRFNLDSGLFQPFNYYIDTVCVPVNPGYHEMYSIFPHYFTIPASDLLNAIFNYDAESGEIVSPVSFADFQLFIFNYFREILLDKCSDVLDNFERYRIYCPEFLSSLGLKYDQVLVSKG